MFIIEDDGDRGEELLEEARRQGFDAQWIRPYNSADSAAQDHIVNISTLDEFISFLSAERDQLIWLWDIGLNFPSDKLITLDQYKKEPKLYNAMLRLMQNGHFFVVTSIQFQMNTFKNNFVKDGAPESSIEFIPSSSAKTYEGIIHAVVRMLERSILASIDSIHKYQFAGGSSYAPQNALTHDWGDNEDKLTAWENFKGILMAITGAPEAILSYILKPYPAEPSGIYKTVQTLVGADAKVHTGEGYVPGLGVLPLLLLRSLVRSGVWTDDGIRKLKFDEKISWTETMREIKLCSEHQPQLCIREWVKELGDTLFPILVKNHPKNGPNDDLESIELNESGRLFRLVFTSNQSPWSRMLGKVNGSETVKGDTFLAWRNVSHLLGACGSSVGRDTRCIINVYARQSKTYWDFRVTP